MSALYAIVAGLVAVLGLFGAAAILGQATARRNGQDRASEVPTAKPTVQDLLDAQRRTDAAIDDAAKARTAAVQDAARGSDRARVLADRVNGEGK